MSNLAISNQFTPEQQSEIKSQITWLKSTMGKGVHAGTVARDSEGYVVKQFGAVSKNELWYSEFRKKYNRRPTITELIDIAIDQLTNGYGTTMGYIEASELFKSDIEESLDLPITPTNYARPIENKKNNNKKGDFNMKKDLKVNATRGIQAGLEFYTFMCPLKELKNIITPTDKLPLDQRANREISKSRIPKISKYILQNKKTYIFNSLTASVDGIVEFKEISKENYNLGKLTIKKEFKDTDNEGKEVIKPTKIILNDGQHRNEGILKALQDDPSLGDETICIQLHVDLGLKASRQRFTDLNKNSQKPNTSLALYYDDRNPEANITKEMILKIDVFNGRIDYEKNKLGANSTNLFGFNALNEANNKMLTSFKGSYIDKVAMSISYWEEVTKYITEWQDIIHKKADPKDIKEYSLAGHGIVLKALGIAGKHIILNKDWKKKLQKLSKIDFKRTNPIWENIAVRNGKIIGTRNFIDLTADFILEALEVSKENIKHIEAVVESSNKIEKPTTKKESKKIINIKDKKESKEKIQIKNFNGVFKLLKDGKYPYTYTNIKQAQSRRDKLTKLGINTDMSLERPFNIIILKPENHKDIIEIVK